MASIIIDEKALRGETEAKEPANKPHAANYPFMFALWASIGGYVGLVAMLTAARVLGLWLFPVTQIIFIPLLFVGMGFGLYSVALTALAASNTFGGLFDKLFPAKEVAASPAQIVTKDTGKGARITLALYQMVSEHYILGDKVTRAGSKLAFFNEANEILLNPLIGLRSGYGKGQAFVSLGTGGLEEVFTLLAAVAINEEGNRYTIRDAQGNDHIFSFAAEAKKGTMPDSPKRRGKKA